MVLSIECPAADGILLREFFEDPQLDKYSVIILDEAHERPLNTDIILGLLKGLVLGTTGLRGKGREKPLRLIITSATLETNKFANYFMDCPIIDVPGRSYPVDIIHSVEEHGNDYENAAIATVLDIHSQEPPGDILVFLTGQAEIERAVRKLHDEIKTLPKDSCGDLFILPLYASLPPEMQARAFAPPPRGARRCIFATNIAETSVTVDGIVYVVDTGVVKQKEYDPNRGIDSLHVVPISRVQAAQRAGRAGRTRSGICYRLYPKQVYMNMQDTTLPEIQRTSLVGAILYLKSLPLKINVLDFDFIDKPDKAALEDALRQLFMLDAIDLDGEITQIGLAMAQLPLEPFLARSVIEGKRLDCIDDIIIIVSMLSQEGSIFFANADPQQLITETKHGGQATLAPWAVKNLEHLMAEGNGDMIFYLRLFEAWMDAGKDRVWCKDMGLNGKSMSQACNVRKQIQRLIDRADSKKNSSTNRQHRKHLSRMDKVRLSLTRGFACRLAKRLRMHNGYRTLTASSPALGQIHPSSIQLKVDDDGLLPEWIIYHEVLATSKVFLKGVCPVEVEWLYDILDKLKTVDTNRLGGTVPKPANKLIHKSNDEPEAEQGQQVKKRRNDESSIAAAKARYLARKNKMTKV